MRKSKFTVFVDEEFARKENQAVPVHGARSASSAPMMGPTKELLNPQTRDLSGKPTDFVLMKGHDERLVWNIKIRQPLMNIAGPLAEKDTYFSLSSGEPLQSHRKYMLDNRLEIERSVLTVNFDQLLKTYNDNMSEFFEANKGDAHKLNLRALFQKMAHYIETTMEFNFVFAAELQNFKPTRFFNADVVHLMMKEPYRIKAIDLEEYLQFKAGALIHHTLLTAGFFLWAIREKCLPEGQIYCFNDSVLAGKRHASLIYRTQSKIYFIDCVLGVYELTNMTELRSLLNCNLVSSTMASQFFRMELMIDLLIRNKICLQPEEYQELLQALDKKCSLQFLFNPIGPHQATSYMTVRMEWFKKVMEKISNANLTLMLTDPCQGAGRESYLFLFHEFSTPNIMLRFEQGDFVCCFLRRASMLAKGQVDSTTLVETCLHNDSSSDIMLLTAYLWQCSVGSDFLICCNNDSFILSAYSEQEFLLRANWALPQLPNYLAYACLQKINEHLQNVPLSQETKLFIESEMGKLRISGPTFTSSVLWGRGNVSASNPGNGVRQLKL